MKSLVPALLLLPSAVFAHAGDHSPLSPESALGHALSSADHLIALAAVLGLALSLRPVRRAVVKLLGRAP